MVSPSPTAVRTSFSKSSLNNHDLRYLFRS
jgi:hypothetical protein